MLHTLISLLGGSSQSEPSKRYRTTCYDFGKGVSRSHQYFGLALAEHIKPDRVIVLGTTGSMWDVLLDAMDLAEQNEETFLDLIESASENRTTQQQLDKLSLIVSGELPYQVSLRLIPYGRDIREQEQILICMADDLAEDARVSLDVTHGLRHLPMLMQMSTLYLRELRKVRISGVYYGSLDMSQNGITPVMRLEGWLDLADWAMALHSFDQDGDYGVFVPLFRRENAQRQAGLLSEAIFYERTFRVGRARGKLRQFLKELDNIEPEYPSRLFHPMLRERINWCNHDNLHQRQQQLAHNYLKNDDFLRCAIFSFEGFITLLCQQWKIRNIDDYTERQKIKEWYEQERPRNKAYFELRDIRNQLAHGDCEVKGETRSVMSSPDKLRAKLEEILRALFKETGV